MTKTDAELADELAGVLSLLRRAVVVASRAAEGLPELPQAKVLVLRTLARTGPLTPARLAEELRLARPTVSNLVRDLVAEGLLERRSAPADRRSVLLVPTVRARSVLTAFRRGNRHVMARAVASLPQEDREKLAAAMPSLHLLLDRVGQAPQGL